MRRIARTASMAGFALSLLGTLVFTAPAHAQSFRQQLGTPVAVPLRALGTIIATNVVRQRNINFIALSNIVDGNMNSQIAIVGVTQGNFLNQKPAKTMYLPTALVGWTKQVNLNRLHVTQVATGNGNTQVAEVAVAQNNYAGVAEGSMRYLFCPAGALGTLFQLNANIVVITQVAVGNGNAQVALVGVAQQNASQLHVPVQYANQLVQINANVTVVTQVATGDGNAQVATLNVAQQNG
jgi:hypothetical protein